MEATKATPQRSTTAAAIQPSTLSAPVNMASSITPSEAPWHIRIFSLNCWGLKYLAKYRHERLSEIGRQLALSDPPPEIVGLQECWTQQDFESIHQQTKHILPYAKFYFGGIFGAGLAILFCVDNPRLPARLILKGSRTAAHHLCTFFSPQPAIVATSSCRALTAVRIVPN